MGKRDPIISGLCVEIQEHVVREARLSGYTLGPADKIDIATDYTCLLIEQNAVDPIDVAYDALTLWHSTYGSKPEKRKRRGTGGIIEL